LDAQALAFLGSALVYGRGIWYALFMSDESATPWTVLALLNWTREYFERSKLDSPRLAAEVLLSHVLGCGRIDLYARFDQEPAPEQRATFRDLVRQAAQHVPVAYLVGHKEFYSLRFRVTRDVLVPRSETEILVTEAIAHLKAMPQAQVAWDICTGSGCVGIALAHQTPTLRVLATDIAPKAVEVAARNAEDHGVSERVVCRQADLLALPEDRGGLGEVFDVITANPPYVAEGDPVGEEVRHEPAEALYAEEDGLALIRRIVADAPGRLKPGGALVLEFGYRHADPVRDLIAATGAYLEPRIVPDAQGIERAAVAVRAP
jgi:release factor glutamine methyltransferase